MKMAILNYPGRGAINIIIRSQRFFINERKCVKFSTAQLKKVEGNSAPIKYTTNKVAKVTIGETIGLLDLKSNRLWYEKEENDIDETLKGNPVNTSERMELLKLKTHLQYCKKNKLPTEELIAKINKIEDSKPHYSPFRM